MATKPKAPPLSTFSQAPAAAVATKQDQAAPPVVMRQKVFRVTPTQDRKIKSFCADSDMTIQDLVIEGINLALKARGLPSI